MSTSVALNAANVRGRTDQLSISEAAMQASWRMRGGARLWRRHPGVQSDDDLTLGERAADRMRNGMGSWTFVFVAIVFLAGWMLGNRGTGFDPYPFILLNLILSCVAALQGAILLIAARRADQISAQLALHDYETNVEALAILTELRSLLEQRRHDAGEESGTRTER